jgi:acyl-CoA thioesterase FadM
VSIFAKLVQDDFFRNVDLGMETMQIVQVDQKFVYRKPMRVGDKLFGMMEVQSVNERFGADIVVTKNTCSNEDGEPILIAYTTLMGHEGDNSIQLRWDKETGQVVRTA